jgi:hypothetical protein
MLFQELVAVIEAKTSSIYLPATPYYSKGNGVGKRAAASYPANLGCHLWFQILKDRIENPVKAKHYIEICNPSSPGIFNLPRKTEYILNRERT